jgi:hypothetical protein
MHGAEIQRMSPFVVIETCAISFARAFSHFSCLLPARFARHIHQWQRYLWLPHSIANIVIVVLAVALAAELAAELAAVTDSLIK